MDMGEEKELCSLGESVLEKWEKATVVCFSGSDVLVGFYLSRVGAGGYQRWILELPRGVGVAMASG